ncbi:MAG: tRNA-dihydrouridine synthase family protein [Clostridiales bacterium]|nr:tRNA-dihydrouridine synthase family protein [Clostridiales bacterium]
MIIYMAPLEGITGYVYRRAFHETFGGLDRYFTPFLTPHTSCNFNAREKKDILPEHNEGIPVVPQILSNNAEDFIRVAEALLAYGYEEVNLNLGCPSGTVTARGRGAGFLADPKGMEVFFDRIFSALSMKISVKTRLGMEDAKEFETLLELYNRYPFSEVILHPRVREDYYKAPVRRDSFLYAMKQSRNRLCYNGDIFSVHAYHELEQEMDGIASVMIGRGLIANPGLAQEIKSKTAMTKEQFKQFHDRILTGYLDLEMGDKNVLFKMKELWYYMIHMFPDGKKYAKRIKKAERISDYRIAVETLFRERELIVDGGFRQFPEKTGVV